METTTRCDMQSCPYQIAKRRIKRIAGWILLVVIIVIVIAGLYTAAYQIQKIIADKGDARYLEGDAAGYSRGYSEGVAFADKYTNCIHNVYGGFTECNVRGKNLVLMKFESGYQEEVKSIDDVNISFSRGGNIMYMMPSGTLVMQHPGGSGVF